MGSGRETDRGRETRGSGVRERGEEEERGMSSLGKARGLGGLHQALACRTILGSTFQMRKDTQRSEVTCQKRPCWPDEWDH